MHALAALVVLTVRAGGCAEFCIMGLNCTHLCGLYMCCHMLRHVVMLLCVVHKFVCCDARQAVADEPGIDVLAFETIPCTKEVLAIERLLRTESFSKPAWISVCCKDAVHLSHGEDSALSCIPVLAESKQIVALGFNCTAPRYIEPLLRKARSV